MRAFLFLSLLITAACSSNYKISVQPPDCSLSPSQQECQQHQSKPVPDEEDSEPTY